MSATRKGRKRAEGGVAVEDLSVKKVRFASQKRVGDLQPYIKKILKVIGHPEAWVSDESLIGDFSCFINDRDKEEQILKNKFKKALNLDISKHDYIIEVAQKLYQRSIN